MAAGDVNGDGVADIITGAGPGGAPHVKVFDGVTGSLIRSFLAFDPAFDGGIFVAAGDVNSDGMADLVVGADAGGAPHVKVFDGATLAPLQSFFAYDAAFTGGVRVAAGDVNGDGVADIVTGAGAGGAPNVKVFDGKTGVEIQSFLATAPAFAGGIYVAVSSGSIAPGTMLTTLIDDVRTTFPQATNLLESAQSMVEAGDRIPACNKIGAFVLQVSAQSGKSLAARQAGEWIQIASDLRIALGCR